MAKLAETPPVVGEVRTTIYGIFASSSFTVAPAVFAICIREMIPSCIRAPPDAVYRITGRFSLTASSIMSVIRSPTIRPMLPIMNRGSITPSMIGIPPMVALPALTASDAPDFACSWRCFSS